MDVCSGSFEFPVSAVCHFVTYDCAIRTMWDCIIFLSQVSAKEGRLPVIEGICVLILF